MKVLKKKQEKKREEVKRPKVVDLRIRLLHEKNKDADGNWVFAPVFPQQGTSDIRIHAKTVTNAKRLLEDYIYNELSGRDDILEEE